MQDSERSGVERSIGRLEGKLDLVIGQMTDLKGAFSTLEAGRLSKLETEVAGLTVKVALLAAGIPIAVQVAIFIIQHYWQ